MGGVADGAGTGRTTVALVVRRREDTEYAGRLRNRRFATFRDLLRPVAIAYHWRASPMIRTGAIWTEMRISGKTGGLFTWLSGSRREAARLNRDARTIIETARAVSRSERLRDVAIQVGDALRTAHARGSGDPSRYAPLIDHFRTQHREARRRRDDGALTALTLVIIYLRAEKIGPDAEPARASIDSFVSEWEHVLTASPESRPPE